MNKIYRLIWSKARNCLVVVAENATSVVKSSGEGQVGSTARQPQWALRLAAFMAFSGLLCPPFALSQVQTAIVTDGRTQTTVSSNGNVYGVSTTTITGNNAFNSFKTFNVGAGDTVNLNVPTSAINLINLVRDQRTDIYGVLNAIKDGRIGGKVWFVNPNGFVVGASGIVNVGSLTLTTSTTQFVDNFFTASGAADTASVNLLLAGQAPRNADGQIVIDGQINAIDDISLSAGTINVGGTLYSGARFVGSAPDFTDVVNANGLTSGSALVVSQEGHIQIVADQDVTLSGTLSAQGANGVDGGTVSVQAGGDIQLTSGALITTEGHGTDSANGDITLTSSGSGLGTAAIDINSATIKGGDITLVASNAYDLSILPVQVPVTGASITIHSSDIDASGKLSATADVTVDASTSSLSPLATITTVSTAKVDVTGSSQLHSGGDTTLAASSTVTADATAGTPDALKLPGDAGVAVNVIVSTATAHVGGSSTVTADGALAITATNDVTATTQADATASGATAAGGTLALTELTSVTTASIDGTAATTADTLTVSANATNTVTTEAKAATKGASKQTSSQAAANPSQTEGTLSKYKDQASTSDGAVQVAAAVAIANVNSVTQAYVASTGQQTSTGATAITTQAASTSSVTADGSSASGSTGVGAAVGLNIGVLVNQAYVADNSKVGSHGLSVSAGMPTDSQNAFTTSAKSGAAASGVGVAGSLASNILVNTTSAYIAGDTDLNGTAAAVNAGTGDVLIEATSNSDSKVTSGADVKGSGDSAKVGVGASVGFNVAVNTTTAEIQDGATLTGGQDLSLNASADHTVSTEVTGGAAGASTAVTPTAAVSIAVNTTVARLGSGTALDIGGDYDSTAEQKSSVSTTATGQTEGSNIAVGASLALGSSTDTVSASVERNITADGAVGVHASSAASNTTSATASVSGGEKADSSTDQPASGEAGTVDKQVAAQGDAAKKAAAATDDAAGDKVNDTEPAPTTESNSSGAVSVAAAVGANVEVTTTTAQIAKGVTVHAGDAVAVTSAAQTDASASADGSQVDSGGTNVGVGAAVALNVAVATNVTTIADNTHITSNGVTVSATERAQDDDKTSDFAATAKSGAGAANVGVAGSLAVNVVVDTTVASIAGDDDSSGTGASVNAGTGDVLIEAQHAATSKLTSGADVKGSDDTAKVGVGASVGLDVVVNTTVAELGDDAELTGGHDVSVNADNANAVTTEVTGGAAGAKIAITPVAAVSVVTDTTVARLGSGDALDITGDYSSTASQDSSVSTKATGQTNGTSVAVGASVALGVAVDTVSASIERDITADGGVGVNASSAAKNETSATASVSGGQKADSNDQPTNSDGTASKTVDEQVADQSTAADKASAGAKTTAADKATVKTTTPTSTPTDTPKSETSDGAVSVAAAVGANVEVATTTAQIAKGRTIQAGGAVSVTSQAQTDASANADGSQVDSGGTNVGVGAAVALNVAVATNVATIADNTHITSNGVTVSATERAQDDDKTSDFAATAKSGAGAANVGVAGSLAANVVVNTTVASIAGDDDSSGTGASVDAGTGDVSIEAQSASTAKATSSADVKGTDSSAKVGVGASVGLNVVAQTTVADLADKAVLSGGHDLTVSATSESESTTDVTGGASGAKVAITPVAAVTIAVNTTTAHVGTSATDLNLSGDMAVQAEGTDTVTTTATGQAQGDVAVGASLAATIAVDTVSSSLNRNVAASDSVDLESTSTTQLTTTATAGAKGAKAANKDADGNEQPDSGTTVDEQKKTQLDFAKSRNSSTKTLDTDTNTPAAETPAVNDNETPSVDQNTNPNTTTGQKQQAKKVSVAAAIGVGVAVNQASSTIGSNVKVKTAGDVDVKATTDTNYATKATGEAVSDDVGVAAAVALTATVNTTKASIASGAHIDEADAVHVLATSTQNRDAAFLTTMGAEAVSGAGGGEVAVAGALAVVGNYNNTEASIDENAVIGSDTTPVGDVTVQADDTSKVAVQARAGSLSKGTNSKAGIGASFAAALSYNTISATVGDGASLDVNSLTVSANRNPVLFNALPNISDVKSFSFDTLDPSTYLGSNNYYTEAVAGAAAKGSTAVAGAFSVNLFMDTTEASIGQNVNVRATGSQAEAVAGTPNAETLGVEVSATSDINVIAFSGAVAGAKKAGVGVSNSDIGNFDQVKASIGSGSVVNADGADAGVKVAASSTQDMTNVSVSGAAATEGTGVAGVLGVIASANLVSAEVGDDASITAQGDAEVQATNDTTTVMVAGGVAGGKEVGVGAAIAVNALWNQTLAKVGSGASIDAKQATVVSAVGSETAATAVVAGAGGGKVGVAGALSINAMFTDTEATISEGAKVNTDSAYDSDEQTVAVTANDDTVIVGVAGGGAGGGKVGVGAAADTAVLIKTVKATIDDGVAADGTEVDAIKSVRVAATSTENIVSVTAGFAGGGSVGVGGAVSLGIVANTVAAHVGDAATVSSEGNVLVNADDGITAVLTAGGGAGGGDVGVGGSLAVATLIGTTQATIGDQAHITALGLHGSSDVYTGDTGRATEAAKGLSVTAYNSENLITTVASGAGGGTAGVAATVQANVIAQTTEAAIGQFTTVNEDNTGADADQQVRVKAVDETVLVDTAAGVGGGGTAGVGAAANVAVIAKTTTAKIGKGSEVNAVKAVDVQATSQAVSVTTTAGFAGGGSAGVGGSVAAVGVANTTEAFIEDGTSSSDAAQVNVSGGDLSVTASDVATSTLITGAGAGGGAAGVGVSLAMGVNVSTTSARIGNYAETNATGTTQVEADAVQNLNAITVAGAGGGSAGVAGTISADVVVSHTEAGIGDHAQVNQDSNYAAADQSVSVKATDTIVTVGAGGAGAGGGAAGVGGSADITFVMATTTASIGDNADVSAKKDVSVEATSDKYVNSVTVAGAGGGAAGVAGAVSVIAVGSLFDDEASSGLNGTNTQDYADSQTTKSAVGDSLGSGTQSTQAKSTLDSKASKLGVASYMSSSANVPEKNTQAYIGHGAQVNAGGDVSLAATDKTLAIVAAGSGAGGGAAGVSGAFGVVLLHDAAEAFVADGATVNAKGTLSVDASTSENVYNVGITGGGAGAAQVDGAIVVNVVTSDTAAYIGAADINQDVAYQNASQSVSVNADSDSTIVTVAASGGGAGAAAVGGVAGTNVLSKDTRAFIGEGANVQARDTVAVVAASTENIINGAVSIHGAGAAGVGAVVSANVVTNTTEAYIGSALDDSTKTGATVDSNGNVTLAASDDTLIVAVSAVGNGAGAAGVGVNVGANVIANTTSAYVGDNSTVNARGNSAGVDVYNGTTGAATAMPSVPGGGSGSIDIDGDGTADGDVSNGVSFSVEAEGNSSGSGGASSSVDPSAKGSRNEAVSGASGGIGAKGVDTGVKGLSIAAVANEKVISATVGVAGAGAAAVTGAASTNVITSTTQAGIGNGVQVNQGGTTGADQSVRVTAADNTFMVQTGGTVSGAGAAAVSGTVDTAVVAKTTTARIGQATIDAHNVAVSAQSSEDLYMVGVNISVAGAAGVGAAGNVAVVTNTTTASVGAGADIEATGNLAVNADEQTAIDLYTMSGAGGIAGVSGAVSVGVIDNTTLAQVEGSSDASQAAQLDAQGTTDIGATSSEDINSVTVSAAGGGVGVAGAVGVKVVKSTTQATIGQNAQINQALGGTNQNVKVHATDTVTLTGGGGSVAVGAFAGAGATAEVSIVRNTTTASVGTGADVHADQDIDVTAESTKDVQAAAVAAAGGGSVGIAGGVNVAVIGAALDTDSQSSIGSGKTATSVDSSMTTDNVSGQLGDSDHLSGAKSSISTRTAALGVGDDLNTTSTASLDKTQAAVGSQASLTAGGHIDVSATDHTQLDLVATGAAAGYVGVGGAFGVGVTHSTTEAFADDDASLSADGDITIETAAGNVDSTGSRVISTAGAGGVVGLSAAVSVLTDTSVTQSYLGSGVSVDQAGSLSVTATRDRRSDTQTYGASVGALAIGASVATTVFNGTTAAYLEDGVLIGTSTGSVGDVLVNATDTSSASARAVAGTAGIIAGSGAVATASMTSHVTAAVGDDSQIDSDGDVTVSADTTTDTTARALGINIGAGAVGASVATATSGATTLATLGDDVEVSADNLTVSATRHVGATPSAVAQATGAAGGLLLGANATVATAIGQGTTSAEVGSGATFTVTGTAAVMADSQSQQSAAGTGVSTGFVAMGADFAIANSSTTTQAVLGDDAKVTGSTLQVSASSEDTNYAYGIAGSGGVVSAPFSQASTSNTSQTYATTGSGNNDAADARKIDVDTLLVQAEHTANFNSWIESTNASLVGVSGAQVSNTVVANTQAHIGTSGYVEADNITLQADNDINKSTPATLAGLTNLAGGALAAPSWNVSSTSGGLADLPAAGSTTTLAVKATVGIGAGAHVEQTGDSSDPGNFTLDAWNDVNATDSVKLSSGGAITSAIASSAIVPVDGQDSASASVSVGALADLSSLGDIAMGARSTAVLDAEAAVDIYGLVGVAPFGSSVATFQSSNQVTIGAGATLDAGRDIILNAGANSSNVTNIIQVTAHSDVYNNTAIPVEQDPVADATIRNTSQISIEAGADLGAARDIYLYAQDGSNVATGVGIGKDIYRETLAAIASAISEAFGGDPVSFETRTGNSVKSLSSNVDVEGTVHTGTQRYQELTIGDDGVGVTVKGTITSQITDMLDVASDIQKRITYLQTLVEQYSTTSSDTTSDSAIAVAAYKSEIDFLKQKLKDLGFASGEVATSTISALQAAQAAVAGMTTKMEGYQSQVDTLTATNTTLTSTNQTLTSNNSTLTSQNATLTGVTIPNLKAQQAALDKNAANYQTKYDQLQQQIDDANSTVQTNLQTISTNTSTITANSQEITANEALMVPLNTSITHLSEQIASLTDDINAGQYSSSPASGPILNVVTVSDATAQLGNIYVKADSLTGSGTLDSPGDAEIKITNTGANFLVIKNLTIPADEGGKVYFNGISVTDNAEINNVNGSAGSASFAAVKTADSTDTPTILIQSTYDPTLDPNYGVSGKAQPKPAGDVIVQGDLTNLRGLVKIDVAAGSIRLEQKTDDDGNVISPAETATVRANQVEIKTNNGDFVQSYTDSFVNTGGDPLVVTTDPITGLSSVTYQAESSTSGIVANGSVLIAARYLNINGVVQSGIAQWGVVIPASATVTLTNGSSVSFAQAQAYYNSLTDAQKAVSGAEYFTVSGATVSGLEGTDWEQITVRYNAKENRLELGGVTVQGGYIKLFGAIYNTNLNGGGELRVLDGYGQIKVDNETSLSLLVNTLDTGRGVAGKIEITDLLKTDANGNFLTTTYTREAGESRTGYSYTPLADIRYAKQVGKEFGSTDFYRYSSDAIFGIDLNNINLDDYWIGNYTSPVNVPIENNGQFLGLLPSAGTAGHTQVDSSVTTNGEVVKGNSWFECNWWTLCVAGTYYQEFSRPSTTRVISTTSVKADNPISISFIGVDNGIVDVVSKGNVIFNGSINNRDGDTSVSSTGSITQSNSQAIVSGNNVSLSAGTGIGSTTQVVQVKVSDSGKLDATSNSGDVRLQQVLGQLNVGTIGGAGVANVYLESDRGIVNYDSSSYVEGQRVELLSNNGGIGVLTDTESNPLTVRTGYTTDETQWPNNGLVATARDSINIKNEADSGNALYSGNLLLISAESLGGDVRIETTGSVIDNNPYATVDTRTEAELAQLWDDLRLRGTLADEKASEAISAYEKGKTSSYQLYWQLRQRQADGGTTYDAAFVFSFTQAEHDALISSGMTEAQISTLAANRTTQYHELNSEVGTLTTSYVSGYAYTATDTEKTSITSGSKWSDAQLELSVGAGLLKAITDTVTTIKEPNAKGRNVTLIAGANIGSQDPVQEIDLSQGLDSLTTAQKAALAAAERGDVTLNGNILTIAQPRPVNVTTTGTGVLNATATNGYVLIGSEEDLRIEQVSATGEIRIKTAGALINGASSSSTVNVQGTNTILEAANGGIGSEEAPLLVNTTDGARVVARAADDIWLNTDGDFTVDTMFSRQDIHLSAEGSILDYQSAEGTVSPDLNILSQNLWLSALTGSIGTSTNALDVGVNRTGLIYATTTTVGQGIWLNGPAGEYANFGDVTSGDVAHLSSATTMKVDGTITAPGPVTLIAGGTMSLTENAKVHATVLDTSLQAGAIDMAAGAAVSVDVGKLTVQSDSTLTMADGATMTVQQGTIDITTVGDAIVTGIFTGNPTESAISITSTEGHILAGHTLGSGHIDIQADTGPAAKLTMWAAQGIGDEPLNLKLLNLEATSGGKADLAVDGSVNIDSITAVERVLLSATGGITGGSVSASDGYVSITGGTGVDLASVSASEDVSISAPDHITVGAINVGTALNLASNQIQAAVTGGSTPVGGAITGYDGSVAQNVTLTLSGTGGFAFSDFWAVNADVSIPVGALSVGNAIILDRATFTNPKTTLLVDQFDKSNQGADVQLYTAGDSFWFDLAGNRVDTDAFVLYRDPYHEVITPDGNNTSAAEAADQQQAQSDRKRAVRGLDQDEATTTSLVNANPIPAVNTQCPDNKKKECEL
ncbi:leukotoxin LktA family filamentous adhesin [Aquabacterium sp.]|uniref:leukotoxin LktA family filamentous adhesin n=1 Tax=Aquabacterium sp. TaxID=1872578 RepID=UPI0035B3CA75